MATVKRKARARLTASRKEGSGALTTASGTLSDAPGSVSAQLNNAAGTNPQEHIAVANLSRDAFLANADQAEKTRPAWRVLNAEITLAVEFG